MSWKRMKTGLGKGNDFGGIMGRRYDLTR